MVPGGSRTDGNRLCGIVAETSAAGRIRALWLALENCLSELTKQARICTRWQPHAGLAACDLVNETMLEAYRDFGQFRGETYGEFVIWLRTILMHNHCNDMRTIHRRRSLSIESWRDGRWPDEEQAEASLAGRDESPLNRSIRLEMHRSLDEAVLNLPEAQRQLIVWRFEERLTYQEIGARLGCSAVSARKSCLRVLSGLRYCLRRFQESREA